MILVSAPLRVSLFGGGSDIKSFYENYGGAFLSLTIDSRLYLSMNSTTNNEVKVHYSKTEVVSSSDELKHPFVERSSINSWNYK